MNLRFLSSNRFKIAEVEAILNPIGVNVIPINRKIEELQTNDVEALVRDKCVKAFHQIGHPLFVEHTGLELSALGGFPAGLTQVFWDTIEADRVSELFGSLEDTAVKATTRIGYCDGKRVHQFSGTITGRISSIPRGSRDFQWDCVFIPEGFDKTFAEMGDEKNSISMRRKALETFADYLNRTRHAR